MGQVTIYLEDENEKKCLLQQRLSIYQRANGSQV